MRDLWYLSKIKHKHIKTGNGKYTVKVMFTNRGMDSYSILKLSNGAEYSDFNEREMDEEVRKDFMKHVPRVIRILKSYLRSSAWILDKEIPEMFWYYNKD